MILKSFIVSGVFVFAAGFIRAENPAPQAPAISREPDPALTEAVESPLAEVETFELPLPSRVKSGVVKIVSDFGLRPGPDQKPENHEGVDFAAPPGTPVKASRSGKVLFAGFSKSYTQRADKKQQNRLIIVRHADGMSTRYVHLGTLKVRPPQEVAQGDVLGTVDASDEGVTPVLHFEIRDAGGVPLDPMSLLGKAPVP